MKYCINCGNPMEDDMLYCQKCGTKATTHTNNTSEKEPNVNNSNFNKNLKSSQKKHKDPKKVASIICFGFMILNIFFGIILELYQVFGISLFFAIIGIMLLLLSKSSQESPYMFGKEKGVSKKAFIIISIIFAFLFSFILFCIVPYDETIIYETTTDCISSETGIKEETNKKDNEKTENNKLLFSDIISDSVLEDNFILSCKATGIDVEEIRDFKKVDDWAGGPRFSFLYKNTPLRLYCNSDSSINSIKLGIDIDIFKEGFEPYQIEDYIVSPQIASELQILAENLVKQHLNFPLSSDFSWLDWSYGRDHNLYSISSKVTAQNAFGVEDDISFKAIYYIDNNIKTLKFFELGNNILFNEMDTVNIPERKQIENKDKTENTNNNETIISITEGQLGNYGKEIKIDGENYINYYVPTGKYLLTSNTNHCSVFIASDNYYKNSDGYTENEIIEQYTFNSTGEQKEIIINSGEHIELTLNSKISLTPIK